MSHTVTVTRTMTTTTTSAIILNTGYFKTWPGILKFFELLLGVACVAVVAYYFDHYQYQLRAPETLYLLMFTTFMIGTFLLLLSCLISLSTASFISKTVYEVVYHGFACLLCLIAALVLLIEVNHYRRNYSKEYEPYFAAAVMGLVLAALYLLSTIFAVRSYRGM